MKKVKFVSLFALIFTSVFAYGGENVGKSQVGYVYQLDNNDTTAFDFQIPNRTHACGSNIYRSYSTSDEIANRKFALVLAAFTSGKNIEFYDNGTCDGSRSKVGWIRLVE